MGYVGINKRKPDTHIYIYIYIYMYVFVCMYERLYVRMHVDMHVIVCVSKVYVLNASVEHNNNICTIKLGYILNYD